ncbi:MAG: aldo/keto reductase [Spirochaetales bacterium]|nr:aldo/keto reductase [Spirochaetales bacterium]
MSYPRCGHSGLQLPAVSLGLWHNFGETALYSNGREMVLRAFDLGITHFDLANNYGPPPGSAESTFGKILRDDLIHYRDELIVSTKAGYDMWPGPYGNFGSRKYLIASLDQSLARMGLDYVDIFYHHRPDPDTPLEETMTALDHIVRSGKALYVGISNYYSPEDARKAFRVLKDLGTPCLIHQLKLNMLDRRAEEGVLDVHEDEGVGCITFSPLEKGILTDRYLNGIPSDSRAAVDGRFLKPEDLNKPLLEKVHHLNQIAVNRGQSLAQMALAWNLNHKSVCSVLIGASRVSQIEECVKAQNHLDFTEEELKAIDSLTL